ncbi:LCP family protein [Pseudonocardia acidicola]|uniref:LCP family protein n=1 Tax=Pseudonocardia acidicola TaxID=2724939 RepID=A0ABX1S3X6_9PSEU|nr:LCP family protein [Pseudonocardia acidicola]NMH96291.1 LCP family protein [Pseudonocardia acidicola]
MGRVLRRGRIVVALLSVLVLMVTGYAWDQYRNLTTGIRTSNALSGSGKSSGGDTNILIMGLDSRLDENGNPLPQDIYDALHAGDQQVGGYNANVLMLLHVPGDGSKATSISIPRDDYVSFPGSPDGTSKGKIKQAYGLAFDQAHRQLVAQGITDRATLEQRSRDAGRKEEIDAVRQFLGGVPVDHFVEVTLVAFYQIAQVVQPITVCLNEATQDSYSGADFHAGQQQITAAQAVAFVRQRRDYVHPELNFTDLDRERRQQAFIASVAYQLKQTGTLADPSRLSAIIDVAKQNMAIDSGLDLLSFAQQASNLTGGNITFTTLPIAGFGKDPAGEDVNLVDVPQVQGIVRNLLDGPPPADAAPPSAAPAPAAGGSGTVDVVNATSRTGLAASVEHALDGSGFTAGATSTASVSRKSTTIDYGPGSAAAAHTLSTLLGGLPVAQDTAVPSGHLRVVLGSNFSMPRSLAAAGSSAGPTAPPSGPAAPAPDTGSALDSISGGGIPCVK